MRNYFIMWTVHHTDSTVSTRFVSMQIENLNAKISEDTEEHRVSIQRAESQQDQLRGEITELRTSLEGAQKEASTHQHQAMQKEAQLKAQVWRNYSSFVAF